MSAEAATGYAERLATVLWEKHWKNVSPEWKPLSGDLIGILTQIDNMTAGLVRSTIERTELVEIIKRLENVAHARHTISHDEYGAKKALRVMADMSNALDEAIALLRLLADAEAALAPFVPLADAVDGWGHPDGSTCEHRMRGGDLRLARAVHNEIKRALFGRALQWDITGTWAQTPTSQYQIHDYGTNKKWLEKVSLVANASETIGNYPTKPEAQAAAQADYESE